MKRIFLLLATIGSMFLTACSTQDDTSHLEIKSSASTFENPYLFIGRGCAFYVSTQEKLEVFLL
ncbi:hypothetical protein, partial [Hallella sp.]|uniref:hypothetical protein n=1 Tax=Hallella sp. TaxID=2980186 RepID=UPI0030790BDC